MSAVATPSVPAETPVTAAAGRPARKPLTPRRLVLSVLAYGIAVIFMLPYLEMVIAALRPNSQVLAANLLPTHFTLHNFTSIWATGFGGNLVASLLIAGGATVLVLLVSVPAAYYSARHRFRGRSAFLLLVLATQMLQPAAMLVGIQREFTTFNLPPTLSLILVNAGFNLAFAVWILNAYFAAIPAELEEASMIDGSSRGRGTAADHPAAGGTGDRHRAHLHLHRRLERVHRRADAVTRRVGQPAATDGGDQQLHRRVLDRLGTPVRRCRHRDDPGDHPVRGDRGPRRQRPHRRLDQVVP